MATGQEQGGGYKHENTRGLGLTVEFWCTTRLVYMHCLARIFMFQIWTEVGRGVSRSGQGSGGGYGGGWVVVEVDEHVEVK